MVSTSAENALASYVLVDEEEAVEAENATMAGATNQTTTNGNMTGATNSTN